MMLRITGIQQAISGDWRHSTRCTTPIHPSIQFIIPGISARLQQLAQRSSSSSRGLPSIVSIVLIGEFITCRIRSAADSSARRPTTFNDHR